MRWAGVLIVIMWGMLAAGCHEETPPPRSGLAPPVSEGRRAERDMIKPLPDPSRRELPPPPFEDAPLLSQSVPEQQVFIEAYNAVNRPRIAVFVNRTLQGDIVSTGNDQPSDTYLHSGQYDEAAAKAIDYAAIENGLAEWLSADHQASIVPAATVRERLKDEEIRRLESGRPRVLGDIAKDLNAHVLVQVQARPTRQTRNGLEIRLIAQAIDIERNELLGSCRLLIPPPLDSYQINRYTRYMARKLMSDMVQTWQTPTPTPGARDAITPRDAREARPDGQPVGREILPRDGASAPSRVPQGPIESDRPAIPSTQPLPTSSRTDAPPPGARSGDPTR